MSEFDSFAVVIYAGVLQAIIMKHSKQPYQEGFGTASQEFWVSLSREKTMKNKVILSGSSGKSSVQYDSHSSLHISTAL